MTQREKLIELLPLAVQKYRGSAGGFGDIADYLLDNGVVLSCRCGECKHFYKYNCRADNMRMNVCKLGVGTDGEDFYCPYGERKGGDE